MYITKTVRSPSKASNLQACLGNAGREDVGCNGEPSVGIAGGSGIEAHIHTNQAIANMSSTARATATPKEPTTSGMQFCAMPAFLEIVTAAGAAVDIGECHMASFRAMPGSTIACSQAHSCVEGMCDDWQDSARKSVNRALYAALIS
jgi:hypothetical protein